MKPSTPYQREKANALAALRNIAEGIRKEYPTDGPAQCMYINDVADAISKNLPASLMYDQRERITKALSDLACKLHPLSQTEKKNRQKELQRQRSEENEWAFY